MALINSKRNPEPGDLVRFTRRGQRRGVVEAPIWTEAHQYGHGRWAGMGDLGHIRENDVFMILGVYPMRDDIWYQILFEGRTWWLGWWNQEIYEASPCVAELEVISRT